MSETLSPDPTIRTERLPRPEDLTEPLAAVDGDAVIDTATMGALEPDAGLAYEDLQNRIAYHQHRMGVAERRRDRAGNRMERMDHKIAFYAEIGALAVDQLIAVETATGEPPRPRTGVERFIEKRVDKRGLKESKAATYKYRQDNIYGPEPTLAGLNKAERRRHKLGVGRAYGMGEVSAREAREARTAIDAQPLKLGELAHKRTRKAHRRTMRKTDRALDPLLVGQKFREKRRNAAIGAIQTNHAKAEHHRRILANLMSEAAGPRETLPTPEPIDGSRAFYDYEAEGDFADETDDSIWAARPPRDFSDFFDAATRDEDDPLAEEEAWIRASETNPAHKTSGSGEWSEGEVVHRGSFDDFTESLIGGPKETSSPVSRKSTPEPAKATKSPEKTESGEADKFSKERLLELDEAIREAIREAAHDERQARGVSDKLPADDFRSLRDRVKREMIEQYLGDEADDTAIERVSESLFKVAQEHGKAPGKPKAKKPSKAAPTQAAVSKQMTPDQAVKALDELRNIIND